jgi:hypothetical protein
MIALAQTAKHIQEVRRFFRKYEQCLGVDLFFPHFSPGAQRLYLHTVVSRRLA